MLSENFAVKAPETAEEPTPLKIEDLNVLLVDDEANVLRSLKRVLRAEGYSILTAQSGPEGLEVLDKTPVHMIISDQRMPHMSGIEFLSAAKIKCPDAVRIVLTGYSDLKTAEQAINQVEIFRFLTKPWNDEDLKVTVKEGLRSWLMRDYNLRLIKKIEEQNVELKDLNMGLEQKVEQRTRALKKAQEQLIQSEKMASVGLLAGGVAHEINNPLAGILALTQLILMEQTDEAITSDLRQIEQAALQCKDIVGGLLSFARQSDDKRREEIFLPSVTDRIATLIGHELRNRAMRLDVEFPPDLPLVWGNPSQMQQVLMNLIMNAAQAMEKHGSIAVRAREAGGGGVEIEVEDQGPGVAEDIRRKVFDPFFTTKPEGEGTGLGLSVTYGIVEDHGGKIEIEGAPGQGALFRVTLPPKPFPEGGD